MESEKKEESAEWKIRVIKGLIKDEIERSETKWLAVAHLARIAHRIQKGSKGV